MKKLLTLFTVFSLVLVSCSDDGGVGPEGPPGPPGADGLIGYTFESTVDFDYIDEFNYWSTLVDVPADIETFDSDGMLVYRLEQVEGDDGGLVDTWSMIPQNYFIDEGTIQYVFNYTAADVELIIDGNFDLINLDTGFTDGQTFRFIVVPADYAQTSGVDVSDYNAVMKDLNITESNIAPIQEDILR